MYFCPFSLLSPFAIKRGPRVWCFKALLDFQAMYFFLILPSYKSNQSLIHRLAADDGAFLEQFDKKLPLRKSFTNLVSGQ